MPRSSGSSSNRSPVPPRSDSLHPLPSRANTSNPTKAHLPPGPGHRVEPPVPAQRRTAPCRTKHGMAFFMARRESAGVARVCACHLGTCHCVWGAAQAVWGAA